MKKERQRFLTESKTIGTKIVTTPEDMISEFEDCGIAIFDWRAERYCFNEEEKAEKRKWTKKTSSLAALKIIKKNRDQKISGKSEPKDDTSYSHSWKEDCERPLSEIDTKFTLSFAMHDEDNDEYFEIEVSADEFYRFNEGDIVFLNSRRKSVYEKLTESQIAYQKKKIKEKKKKELEERRKKEEDLRKWREEQELKREQRAKELEKLEKEREAEKLAEREEEKRRMKKERKITAAFVIVGILLIAAVVAGVVLVFTL